MPIVSAGLVLDGIIPVSFADMPCFSFGMRSDLGRARDRFAATNEKEPTCHPTIGFGTNRAHERIIKTGRQLKGDSEKRLQYRRPHL
jgi:hypothetical protein